MAGPVRLVATDLDGTLLRADGSISDRTRRAVADAVAAGIQVVAATGRGWRSATPVLAPVPEITTAVCSNGSLVRDLAGGRDLDTFPILPDRLALLVDVIADVVPDAGVFWERIDGVGFDATYVGLRPGVASRGPVADSLPIVDDTLKVLVLHPSLHEADLFTRILPALPTGLTLSFSGGPGLVEITGANVHKARALAVVCDRLGIDRREVVAIGDNQNDAEMLAWAGHGVAMGNARPEAVEAADSQTAHHLDDGVALVLEAIVSTGEVPAR